jgi:hypothetical protein
VQIDKAVDLKYSIQDTAGVLTSLTSKASFLKTDK